jgi:transglutaminase-like putative cysteine protease
MRSIPWRKLFFLGALAAPSTLLRAGLPDGVFIEPPPAWVVPVTPADAGQPKLNPAGQDFLLLDRQINVANGETYDRRAFQIVSDEGRRNGGQVHINFDPSYQTLALHHLRVVRTGQIIDRLDPANVQLLQQERDLDRQLYNGERSVLVILQDLRVGDVIDLAYTARGRNPVFARQFIDVQPLGWGVPVRELRCRVLTPVERVIHHQIRGEARPEFTDRTTAHGRELLWICRNLPALDADDHTPSWHVVYPFLELTEFASWPQVVAWALPLYSLESEPTSQLAETVRQIARTATSTDTRIVAALRFVQAEIRYLGIELGAGSHRPSTPEEVLQRRFGDCKDKARLLTAILRHLGIDAAPALVHSSRRHTVNDWLPSPFAFDHVVVTVDTPGRRLILDPTLVYQLGATPELRHLGGYGPYLRIAPDTQTLLTPQTGPSDLNFIEVRETFRVTDLQQPAELTVATTYRGAAANQIRGWFATNSMEQVRRQYVDFYTRYYPGLESISATLSKMDDDAQNLVEVTEHYRIPHLFVTPAAGTIRKA